MERGLSILQQNPVEFPTILSIVTVNLNDSAGVARTLASLENARNDLRVECIFIDGGSKDDSVSLATRFYRPDNIVSEPDRGIYHAMNKGLHRAKGKYVLWLNSGDEMLPGALELVLPRLQASEAALVSFAVKRIPARAGEPTVEHVPVMSDLPGQTFSHQSTFFDRQACLDLGGYSEAYRITADRRLILQMYFKNLPIELHDDVIANFYSGGVSSSWDVHYENALVDLEFGLVGVVGYFRKVYRLNGRRGVMRGAARLWRLLRFRLRVRSGRWAREFA